MIMWRSQYRTFTVLATLVLFLVNACDVPEKEPEVEPQNPLWSEYIGAHTTGLISKESKIRVRFVNEAVDEQRVGQSAEEYIDIRPSIKGSVTFSDTREIVILPDEGLESGRKYHITVKAKKLIDLPEELKDYEFTVQVIKQEFEARVIGLSPNPLNDREMVLRGSLVTADIEDADKIEKVVTATYLKTSLPLEWQHNVDGKHHEFTVSGIERQQTDEPLTLAWSGAGIGVESDGSTGIEVPARDVFRVMDVRAVQGEQQYIAVSFSGNVSQQQNLRGLVLVGNEEYRTRVEGNTVKVYPGGRFVGQLDVTIEEGIQNDRGGRLQKQFKKTVAFTSQKPQVRFVGKGVILPDNEVLSIPFEAINVDSVQVTAFRIYDNNVGRFLQANKLDGNYEQGRVGRHMWRKTIYFSSADPDKWNRYSLDATQLLRENPGGLFRLTISINRGNSTYSCTEADNLVPVAGEEPLKNNEDLYVSESSGWDYAEDYYGGGQSSIEWRDRNNPCKDAYYRYANGTKGSRNFLASNIGLLAKRGQRGRMKVVATDLKSSEVMEGVEISIMNFQDQIIETAMTDGEGFAEVEVEATPFYLVAEKDGQKGYLKLSKGTALPVSHFDVGGDRVKSGIKGYIYGERGVWRPGDNVYLTFVLQDKNDVIPQKHPVTMKLYNPKGQLIQSVTNSSPVGDFYSFTMKTAEDALTGSWTAKAQLGGSTFSRKLKIETVIPNRLKVELDLGRDTLYKADMPVKGKVFGQWLHGATASGLKTDVKVQLKSVPTRFDRYGDYIFDDPVREFRSEPQLLFEGKLDSEGYAAFKKELWPARDAPGALSARFTTRVFEEGGAFSSGRKTFAYYPYENYVGVKMAKGDRTRGMLLTDVRHKVSIATVNALGEPVDLKQVRIELYKIKWKWWWDKSGESLAQYAYASHSSVIQESTISTTKGQGSWEFEIKYPAWGRYLVRACDLGGEHCSGKVVYIDWPGWAGRAQEGSGAGASILSFFSDKKVYEAGETAVIQLPEATQGRALLSIENGSRVLEQRWVEFEKGKTRLELPLTREMSPNIYVSVTLIQPHRDKKNDRPIRLYGVIPIVVQDPATILKPLLKAADEWSPESTVSVEVSEKEGRRMTYTVALVDEGLLGLTAFKTPDLHRRFYRKEALGVTTWDLFDFVAGAYGGELERLLALGGDGEAKIDEGDKDKRRFPPVVRFLGPFQLEAGKANTHEFDLPQYVGAVRVMVVSGEQGAYGYAAKSVFVRESLMLLATLPRVIGPEEELAVPVSLFVMDDNIKEVTLKVEPDDKFRIVGSDTVSVKFDKPGEKVGMVRMKVGEKLGKGRVGFTATGGGAKARSEIFIDIRSANTATVRHFRKTILPGESWEEKAVPHGLLGTNEVSLEVSSVPPLDLERRLKYLIRYPHGCVEQTTSSVFPQLYLPLLTDLGDEDKKEIEGNINAGIYRLRSFQVGNGGFVYWPGGFGSGAGPASWATSYVGHFLVEAEKRGYFVPPDMLSDWVGFQKSMAQSWVAGTGRSELEQAYRLYTLALAGQAELGAMNRMRESARLSSTARWQLAAAYRLAGLPEAARELVEGEGFSVVDYLTPGPTYGSKLRDKAIILNSLVAIGDYQRATGVVEEISAALSEERWHSTQTVAYSLLAISNYIGDGVHDTAFTFERKLGAGEAEKVSSGSPIHVKRFDDFPSAGESIMVKNISDRPLTATITIRGVPKAGREEAVSSGLGIKVSYSDMKGRPVNVAEFGQGTDFMAQVRVSNHTDRNFDNIALTHIVPSGWEIHNTRMDGGEEGGGTEVDYQDIRDDRIYTYFGLKAGESKEIKAVFNAAYLGKYYLPGISVEAMYDALKHARTKGQWVTVIKSGK
ncbi:MAG: MG2 domain-containing protein [Thermodesulfobacteriota bacterium]